MNNTIADLLPSNVATTSATPFTQGEDELGQEDFLKLMIAQLQNQDPTSPADSSEFLSQIAEFSVVEGVSDLNTNFSDFTQLFAGSQTMDAVNLVGRSVMTQTNTGYLAEDSSLTATIDMPSYASSGTVYVQDEYGVLVDQITLGSSADGYQDFTWDGTDLNGDPVEPGKYRISAEAFIDGQTQSVSVYAHNEVESVVLNTAQGGYELRLADGSTADLSEVLGVFQ